MDSIKNFFILLTNPFIFPFLIFLLFVLAINLPFIIFFYVQGFFALSDLNEKEGKLLRFSERNTSSLGFLFLPTRLAIKSIEATGFLFVLLLGIFNFIFTLFIAWQILRQSYLLFSLFGWNWLAWIGFILALVVLFLVVLAGFNDMDKGIKIRKECEEIEQIIKNKRREK